MALEIMTHKIHLVQLDTISFKFESYALSNFNKTNVRHYQTNLKAISFTFFFTVFIVI